MFSSFLLFFSILPSSFAGSSLKPCTVDTSINETCGAKVGNLRPTQFSVGMIEVRAKEKALKQKSDSDYQKYLKKNPVPVVIGNGGQFYMVDKHHEARAVYELGKEKLVVQVIRNLNSLEGDEFWNEMTAEHYFYNRDENNEIQPPSELPDFVGDMTDDPFRSLSGAVRDAGGYQKVSGVYYLEFIWARFFRELDPSEQVTLSDLERNFNSAVKRAIDIAHSDLAAQNPGYSPKSAKN